MAQPATRPPIVYRGTQSRAVDLWKRDAKFHIFHGPVRSGKTVSALDGFAYHAQIYGGEYLLSAPTMGQIKKVLLPALADVFGKRFRYLAGDKHATVDNVLFHVYSGSTEASEGTLRGLTLRGAFIDEATLVPESFWDQAIARCSLPGAKIVACTNPDSPFHWLKRKWIDRADGEMVEEIGFRLEDNPSLTADYKAMLSRLTGAEYARKVLGQWVEAEGAIYPGIHEWIVPKLPWSEDADFTPEARWIAVDSGEVNDTHALLIEQDKTGVRWITREWVHSRSESGPRPVDDKARELLGDLLPQEGVGVSSIICDPAAQDMVAALRRYSPGVPVVNAVNDVLLGIQHVRNEFENDLLRVYDGCSRLVSQLATYAWDQRAANRGVQKPVKRDDHGPDALRYCVATTAREIQGFAFVDERGGPSGFGFADERGA